MPRKKNLYPMHKVTEKSKANLRPTKKGGLSAERAKELGSKGGKAAALKFKTDKELVEAVILAINTVIGKDQNGVDVTVWEGALNTAAKSGITNGRNAMDFIKMVMGILGLMSNKEQTINVIQTKDKQTLANEIKIAREIIAKLKK